MFTSRSFYLQLLVLTLLSILVGCGGGSGGDVSPEPPPPTNNATNVNGNLSGKVFVSDGWIIDIATGMIKRTPGVIWDSWCLDYEPNDEFDCLDTTDDYMYPSNATFGATPSYDGSEYIVTALDCHTEYYNRDCLAIHELNSGEPLGERGVFYKGINFSAKLSDNKEYIALTYNETPTSSTILTILDRNYDKVMSSTLTDSSHVGFDWSSTGQIVYGFGREIYLTSSYSTEGSPIFSLDNYPSITHMGLSSPIRVSPDGEKILFMLVEDGDSLSLSYDIQSPWIMNIDGTDLHKLAYVPKSMSEYELFGSLAWSPDGRYVLVTEGYSPQATSIDSGVGGNLYAIPSSSRNVALNDSGEDGVIRIQTNYMNRSKQLRYRFNGSGIWWIP
jgi:Tol biopolymer transport system component